MKMHLFMAAATIVLCSAGCGTSRSNMGATLASLNHRIVLSGKNGDIDAELSSSLALQNGSTRNGGDWLVLSWSSPARGTANLTLSRLGALFQEVSLSLEAGDGAILIDATGKLMTSGHVSGSLSYMCGPHGSMCNEVITAVTGDLTYPCGPQGATCRLKVSAFASSPANDDDDEVYVCGPQGMRCHRKRVPPVPVPAPTVCGPQGMHC